MPRTPFKPIPADAFKQDESDPGFSSLVAGSFGNDLTPLDGFDSIIADLLAAISADQKSMLGLDGLLLAADFADGELASADLGQLATLFTQWSAAGDVLFGDVFSTLGKIGL